MIDYHDGTEYMGRDLKGKLRLDATGAGAWLAGRVGFEEGARSDLQKREGASALGRQQTSEWRARAVAGPRSGPAPAHADTETAPSRRQRSKRSRKSGCLPDGRLRLSRGPLRLVSLTLCATLAASLRASLRPRLLASSLPSSSVCVPACASVSSLLLTWPRLPGKPVSQSDQSRLAVLPRGR
ncbi:hypothetical protein VTN96DRAFT_4135 [Rasamsonia emersonii]